MPYYVYILTNARRTVLYTGFTGHLEQRMEQHKAGNVAFTKKYNVTHLIYYETFQEVNEARARERAIKKWNRAWKNELITKSNPEWNEMVVIL